MKFKMIIEDGKKTLALEPENAGEQAILASLVEKQGEAEAECTARLSWSNDREPYKKCTGVGVVFS